MPRPRLEHGAAGTLPLSNNALKIIKSYSSNVHLPKLIVSLNYIIPLSEPTPSNDRKRLAIDEKFHMLWPHSVSSPLTISRHSLTPKNNDILAEEIFERPLL